ncbi:MAG TPA: cation transporter [Desulfonatronum sp.]|nr:cation transporter [Desulfonatronum sp.]
MINRPRFPFILFRTALIRLLMFGLLWWVLTEGEHPLSLLGLAGVGSAAAVSMSVFPAGTWKWRFGPLIRFIPFFLWQSLLGGLDVAYRALRPKVDVQPEVIRHRLVLQQEPARVFFLWVISLLPGTAAVGLHGDETWVHVLDTDLGDPKKLHDLETRIAELFAEK